VIAKYYHDGIISGGHMPMNRAQVVINLSPVDAQEFDLIAQSLGFPSRASYVVFLHRALKVAMQLGGQEGQVLQHLGIWGFSNFRKGSPDLRELASHCFTDESMLRKTLEKLKDRGLLKEAVDHGGPFDGDVRIGSGRRCFITQAGRTAAQAVGFLQSLQIEMYNRSVTAQLGGQKRR
jgi:hypothetical protein